MVIAITSYFWNQSTGATDLHKIQSEVIWREAVV
jgi:hypothetical protein